MVSSQDRKRHTVLGFVQEFRAERAISALKSMPGFKATVLSDSEKKENCHFPAEKPGIEDVLESGLFCNQAVLSSSRHIWHVSGSPTEGALVVAAHKSEIDAYHQDMRPVEKESSFN